MPKVRVRVRIRFRVRFRVRLGLGFTGARHGENCHQGLGLVVVSGLGLGFTGAHQGENCHRVRVSGRVSGRVRVSC